ncbi:unnamed protein product [Pseudo-nitzschia multistriata]|uniref:Uncharacterized protein n=1 Tax=Pseudo-nitzschia multistriata TaxID=183589 RepID=A0A448Z9K1_9STRA|nr:unnamed protein product [Pseudo-nitzschia multistriata]
MAPWSQIVGPFSFHFAVNCCKTMVGAGLVGYGVALAATPVDELSEVGDEDEKETTHTPDDSGRMAQKTEVGGSGSNGNYPSTILVRKYVKIAVTIGFGLFLSLPSLMSQIVWETMIPGITATDIVYDVSTENVRGMIPKWSEIIKKPTLPGLGGLIGGKEGRGGQQMKTITTIDSSRNEGSL